MIRFYTCTCLSSLRKFFFKYFLFLFKLFRISNSQQFLSFFLFFFFFFFFLTKWLYILYSHFNSMSNDHLFLELGWLNCRICWLHLCRRVRHPPLSMSILNMTQNHLMLKLKFLNLRESGVSLHYFQVYSDSVWKYLLGSYLGVKEKFLNTWPSSNKWLMLNC